MGQLRRVQYQQQPQRLGILQFAPFEAYLWLLLSAAALFCFPAKPSLVVTLFNVITRCFLAPLFRGQPSPTGFDDIYWRQPTQWGGDMSGEAMSLVLLPVLLEAMAAFASQTDYSNCERYAWIISVSSIVSDLNIPVVVLAAVLEPSMMLQWESICFMSFWAITWHSMRFSNALHGVWTRGEWILVSSIAAIACTECVSLSRKPLAEEQYHQYIALSGWMSCFLSCVVVTSIVDVIERRKNGRPVAASSQVIVIALSALSGVELFLFANTSTAASLPLFPRSLHWLNDFLLHSEVATTTDMPFWNRATWVIYWLVVLIIAIPLAPNNSPAIARKWFHAVAMVLFVPVSLACPLLQSLAYAVSLSVLMVMECIRQDVSIINHYFERYMDESRDAQNVDGVVVSHMCLIFGCAAPLWIADALRLQESHPGTMGVLSLWGVLCLGVGDSMGAIIGSNMGRIEWGKSRTVEGSLAMLISMLALYTMLAIYFDLFGSGLGLFWVPAVFFVTFLEAFTHQIDNLVLPLAGAAVILMSRQLVGEVLGIESYGDGNPDQVVR
jgi:dolichol kinase